MDTLVVIRNDEPNLVSASSMDYYLRGIDGLMAEPEKRLPHPRKAAGAQITQSRHGEEQLEGKSGASSRGNSSSNSDGGPVLLVSESPYTITVWVGCTPHPKFIQRRECSGVTIGQMNFEKDSIEKVYIGCCFNGPNNAYYRIVKILKRDVAKKVVFVVVDDEASHRMVKEFVPKNDLSIIYDHKNGYWSNVRYYVKVIGRYCEAQLHYDENGNFYFVDIFAFNDLNIPILSYSNNFHIRYQLFTDDKTEGYMPIQEFRQFEDQYDKLDMDIV
ncbi:10786_t:CDS:2 [Dentiscutata heterogama]|uniref:10786_t:CDS:1 n=1 Tax=Dentiscutata heterogama TaxID=1316150 RepID=A0ACA9L9F0_9GLOM|nr:10786_t:CDS:2 [Dentiscutata heterogama]